MANNNRGTGNTPCVAVIAATAVPIMLNLRVEIDLPHVRALGRLAQGVRKAKYRFDGEWEFPLVGFDMLQSR